MIQASQRLLRHLVAPGLFAALASSACGASNQDQGNLIENKAAGAAVAVGAGVAFAGIHRAVTGGCWAMCQAKQVCDSESGLCVDENSGHQCPQGEQPVRRKGGLVCEPYAKWADDCGCPQGERCLRLGDAHRCSP